jgi:hypothetical protein
MRFIKVIALGIIGLLLGIGWFQLETSGYFERWERLPNRPAEVLELFSPEISADEYGNPQTCDRSSPEFSFLSNTPNEIANCVQRIDRAADANFRTVYVIDESGEVWTWSYFDYAYYYYAKRIIFPTIGFIFGLLTASLLSRQVPNRQQFLLSIF